MLRVHELRRPGLFPVSFTLADGECISLMGPSGAGKTLLLRTLADLDPNEGEVFLDERSWMHFSGPAWRRRVMYLPAESGWWSERVSDHFPDWNEAAHLVETLGLPAKSRDWPVQRLSTGERQRLALVRTLVHRPRVLLLDEPTSGLDQATALAVERLLGECLKTGASALWVTHDTAQAHRMGKRCLYIQRGHVHERTHEYPAS